MSSPIRRIEPCPGCGKGRLLEEVRIVPYFELFFIPLVPLGRGTRVLRCSECGFEMPTISSGSWTEATAPKEPREAEIRDWGFGSVRSAPRASTEQKIYCVHCGRPFAVQASERLQHVRCPACGHDFEVRL